MNSQLIGSTERLWNVTLLGYVEANQTSQLLLALDVDDAERIALRTDGRGSWSLAGDDRQALQVTSAKSVVDRYVTHCTQHGAQHWVCGLSAQILVGRQVSVKADSAEVAKKLALSAAPAGTWGIVGDGSRPTAGIEIQHVSALSGLHAVGASPAA